MRNAAEAVMGVIEGDAVCVSLLAFLKTQGDNWGGKPEELFIHLNNFRVWRLLGQKSWPRNPQNDVGLFAFGLAKFARDRCGKHQRKSHGVRLIEIVRK